MDVVPRANQPTKQSILPKPELSLHGLQTLIWCCFAAATVAYGARIYARLKFFGKIFSDDYAVSVAWLVFLGHCICCSLDARLTLRFQSVAAGIVKIWPTFIKDSGRYYKFLYAQVITYSTSLYAVKLSFLLFFRRLSRDVRKPFYEMYWWFVFAIVFLGYAGCWITLNLYCPAKDTVYCSTPRRIRLGVAAIKFSVGADVATDMLIIFLPVYLLWGVKIPLKRKLLVLSILCAGLGIVVIAIVRGAAFDFGKNTALDRQMFWGVIELCVAIVLCSLASYQTLFFSEARKSQGSRSTPTSSSSDGWTKSFRSRKQQDSSPTSTLVADRSADASSSSIKSKDDSMRTPVENHHVTSMEGEKIGNAV